MRTAAVQPEGGHHPPAALRQGEERAGERERREMGSESSQPLRIGTAREADDILGREKARVGSACAHPLVTVAGEAAKLAPLPESSVEGGGRSLFPSRPFLNGHSRIANAIPIVCGNVRPDRMWNAKGSLPAAGRRCKAVGRFRDPTALHLVTRTQAAAASSPSRMRRSRSSASKRESNTVCPSVRRDGSGGTRSGI